MTSSTGRGLCFERRTTRQAADHPIPVRGASEDDMEINGSFDLLLRRSEVMRYLGYRPGVTEVSSRVEAIIDEALSRVRAFLEPRVAVTDIRIEATDEEEVRAGRLDPAGLPSPVASGDPIVWRSKSLARLLKGCRRATVMCVTIGPRLENESSACFARGDFTLGAIYDAAGSEAVECLADEVNARIDREARAAGHDTTARFSPGYGGWALKDQQALLALVGADGIGVELTTSMMLDPQKSVTAVVGWRPLSGPPSRPLSGPLSLAPGKTSDDPDRCRACDMKNCRFRGVSRG